MIIKNSFGIAQHVGVTAMGEVDPYALPGRKDYRAIMRGRASAAAPPDRETTAPNRARDEATGALGTARPWKEVLAALGILRP